MHSINPRALLTPLPSSPPGNSLSYLLSKARVYKPELIISQQINFSFFPRSHILEGARPSKYPSPSPPLLSIGPTSRHHRGIGADLGWVQAYMHKAHADCHSHPQAHTQVQVPPRGSPVVANFLG